MRRSALYILTAVLLASGCNKALMEPQRMGSIRLSLSSDVEVVVGTKADTDIDYDSFNITIAGPSFIGNDYSQTYKYAQMDGGVTVPFGTYVLSAESCTEDEAIAEYTSSYGCVRYAGAVSDVSIMSAEPVNVSVTCPMVNAKATLTFDESFLMDFTDPSATLTVGERTVTLKDADDALAKAAYFNLDSATELTYVVQGTIDDGTPDGKRLSYTGTMNIDQAKWAKIVIKSNHNGQIGGPDITVDENMGENSFTETIDPNAGNDSVDGDVNLPSIIVDTTMDDAVVVDCIIEI